MRQLRAYAILLLATASMLVALVVPPLTLWNVVEQALADNRVEAQRHAGDEPSIAALDARDAELRHARTRALWLEGAGLIGFNLVIGTWLWNLIRSVRMLTQTAGRIGDGELVKADAEVQLGQIGLLVGAFNEIVHVLAKIMKVVDRMAVGDFSTQIRPRSQADAMSWSFVRMNEGLTTLIGQIQRTGIQVNSSINEIAATAKQQQATATETAATTMELGATAKEISATTGELVRTMADVASTAEQSAALAGSGREALAAMEDKMRAVTEAASSISTRLGVLSDKAAKITAVVTTITKVAEQTNLLSLNAAIEAEKAGEYGRGFSVVATEIRRLADQTAVSTFDIEQMVKEIQSAVAGGVMSMERFTEETRAGLAGVREVSGQLSRIIEHAQALAPKIMQVNEGMHAQATGAEQITQALTQLTEASQETVESLRQSGQAIQSLNDVAGQLRAGVSRFKIAA